MLLQRVITAAVLILVLVPTIMWGGLLGIAILVGFLASVGLLELARIFPALTDAPQKQITVALGPFIAAGFAFLPLPTVIAVPVLLPLVVLVVHLILYDRIENTLESVSQMVFAAAYVAVPLGHAILLRRIEHGVVWIFYVLVVICVGDACAYFAGRAFGRHRLSAKISPSKTVEGLLGGVAGNLAAMLGMKLVVPALPPLGVLLVLTLLLAVTGPLGDLCASAIKRKLSVKDFGSSVPGHGGLMDRADSLVFSFPVTYYFLLFAGYAVPK